MIDVDSDALQTVQRALGVPGRGAQITQFADGQLDQVLNVAPMIRRGRTFAGNQGIYTALLENNHAGADSQVSTAEPYNMPVGTVGSYPSPVPPEFDLWIIAATVRRTSGSGTLSAGLYMDLAANTFGWGVDEAAAAVAAQSVRMIFALWDATTAQGTQVVGTRNGELPWVSIGFRFPRHVGADLMFRTTSSAAAVFNCQLLLGLFPVALGQDALV